MTPRPYQLSGARYLAGHPRGVLGDEPGLGKTGELILAAQLVGARNILVICPAVAKVNWEREFRLWWPEARPVIVSYDWVVGAAKRPWNPLTLQWDVLILDEAHYLKNRESKRARAIYRTQAPEKGLVARAKFCWAASGTLAPNDATEYWTHLRVLRPDLITLAGAAAPMNFTEFLMRYTDWSAGPYSIRIHSVRRRDELERILGELGIRRTVVEVLPDLPPLVWGTVSVPPDMVVSALDRMGDSPQVLAIREQIETTGEFHAGDTVHLATLRRLIGEAKAQSIAQLLDEELAAGAYPKIVVWGWHKDVLSSIHAALPKYRPVLVYGATTPGDRQRAIDKFQTDPECRIFVGQIIAAGTAITLTAANQVLFAESSWVPDEDLQAAKRCHRLGQTLPVFARIAALAGSVDELIAAAQARKLAQKVEIGALV